MLIIFGVVSFNAYKDVSFKNGIFTTAEMNLQIPTEEHVSLYTNSSLALKCNGTINKMKSAKRPLHEIEVRRLCC